MKAIMVMFDSLNRGMLEPYGCDWIKTPNFEKLKQQSVTFENNYVASMPCMPARRDLHTGRYGFQHRGWGPLEPFDNSMPEILKNNGIYTHLSTDHQHYWEDGGANYHARYSSYDLIRGQEGDEWKVTPESITELQKNPYIKLKMLAHDGANRAQMTKEEDMPQARTFAAGLEFIENNHEVDNWFLQIETFDPHEPFFTQDEYKKAFEHEYNGQMKDWPPYFFVTEGPEDVQHMRYEYAALITMCDHYLGKVLAKFDEYNLWEDTMLIVNTDHGYLLGEHDWWSKGIMPVYDELARIPLFFYDPRNKIQGERRNQLTQMIDIPVTLLDFFNVDVPEEMQGRNLQNIVEKNEVNHDNILFGFHEGHTNLTDGEWVYMKAPVENDNLYNYTLMPAHMRSRYSPEELKNISLHEPFSFTKGVQPLKVKANEGMNNPLNFGTKLFNLVDDPKQNESITDFEMEAELANRMVKLMKENDSPDDRFERFGFDPDKEVTEKDIEEFHRMEKIQSIPEDLLHLDWDKGAQNMYRAVQKFLPEIKNDELDEIFNSCVEDNKVTIDGIWKFIHEIFEGELLQRVKYVSLMSSRID